MSYNYLTINGITKICDDNIYIDENGKFTQIQWYDFQLDFALKNLNTDLTEYLYHPLTNYKLTRSEILELIFKITGTNIINTSDSVKKEDLIKHNDTKSSSCITDLESINPKKSNISTKVDSTLVTTKTGKKLKIRRKKKSSKGSKKSSSTSDTSSDSLSSDITVNVNKKPNATRAIKGKKVIRDSADRCRKLGKFDWSDNLCYMDSILIGVFYTAILNKAGIDPID